jgi:hypothetical protein
LISTFEQHGRIIINDATANRKIESGAADISQL